MHSEFADLCKLAQHRLDRRRVDIVTADNEHVIHPAEDPAIEPGEVTAAGASAAGQFDKVASAIADQRAAPAAEVRQDELALLSVGNRLASRRVDHLCDELA